MLGGMEGLEGRATWWVSRAHLHAHAILQELFAEAGARPYHYRLLVALDDLGAVSQAALGRATELDRSDVSVALGVLAERGCVVRESHPSDRRQNVVSITGEGRIELARLDEVVDRAQELFLAPLAQGERVAFLDMVTRLGGGQRRA